MSKEETAIEELQFEELIKGLIENEYGCCNQFLAPDTLVGLRANMLDLATLGKMKDAGVGNKSVFQKDKLVRSDTVNWIEEQSINPFEVLYLRKIGRFIAYLNQTCFTSITNFESHYSHFKIGSFYKKHIDQFKDENARKYSVILYLNQNWNTKDQGNLSLYPLDKQQQNIAPLEGRIVFFKSDEMEHEVHPSTTRDRKSIAGWLKI